MIPLESEDPTALRFILDYRFRFRLVPENALYFFRFEMITAKATPLPFVLQPIVRFPRSDPPFFLSLSMVESYFYKREEEREKGGVDSEQATTPHGGGRIWKRGEEEGRGVMNGK